jgi:hypothetical protein
MSSISGGVWSASASISVLGVACGTARFGRSCVPGVPFGISIFSFTVGNLKVWDVVATGDVVTPFTVEAAGAEYVTSPSEL